MARFTLVREGARAGILFDDGGVNLLSSAALRELRALVASLGVEPDPPRLLTFRSSHPSIFAAGADMDEMRRFDGLLAASFSELGQQTLAAIERLPLLTCAVIDGDCFGGALDLILAFDLRFGTARSRFSHPGGKLGIVTGFGGTTRWRGVLGPADARQMFLGNPVLDAAAAHVAGLVDGIGEPDIDRLLAIDPRVVRMVKELTVRGGRMGDRGHLRLAELLGRVYGIEAGPAGPGTPSAPRPGAIR